MNDYIESTSESQGHGKAVEVEILCNCFGYCKDTICRYKHTEKYDGLKEDSLDGRNKSIKMTGKNAPDCGDIIRFLESEEIDLIILKYEQRGDYKYITETVSIGFEVILEKIKKGIQEKYGKGYNEWVNDIREYIKSVKDAPRNASIKELPNKRELELPYFGIRPKTSQNRVQCELKLKHLLPMLDDTEYKIERGGEMNGKKYISKVLSPPRRRVKKS